MNIEKQIEAMPYHDKHIYIAFKNEKLGSIIYFFDKTPTDEGYNGFESITAIIVDTNLGVYDMTMPYISQLNKYYGDYVKFNSKYIGKHCKLLLKHLSNREYFGLWD